LAENPARGGGAVDPGAWIVVLAYGVAVFAVTLLACLSRSRQILTAAAAVACGWLFSSLWYFAAANSGEIWGAAGVDCVLAIFFWRQSRGRWFPVPLFFIHAGFLLYYAYTALLTLDVWFWIAAFVNRLFDLVLLYIGGCAIYRIRALRKRSRPAVAVRIRDGAFLGRRG
jgi:hypothetical protein